MIAETIIPQDESAWLALRCRDLTSTDIPALFGMSPYKTHFELWHEKRSGERPAFNVSERMKWGTRLEAAVAEGIAADQGWCVRPMKEYVRLPSLRLGSSFDFRIQGGVFRYRDGDTTAFDTVDDAILEIKTVDARAFASGWIIEDDFIEATAHIELQVQHQMLVSGLRRAYIGVLVGGNDVRILERSADQETHAAIADAARSFWQSIEADHAPDPVMPRDAGAVIRLHGYAEPGKLLDARDDAALSAIAAEYNALGKQAGEIENTRKVLKADMLARIGDHEKTILAGWKISAGMIGPTRVEYDRSGYRDFRITAVKSKA